MGDEADYLIERMLLDKPHYAWKSVGDSRARHNARCSSNAPHALGCRCPGCVHERTTQAQLANDKPLSIERAFKEANPYDVPTHIVCKRCQATGLHWGLRDGKPEMREEGGWPHKCKKIEGVTLNLPNILDPQ